MLGLNRKKKEPLTREAAVGRLKTYGLALVVMLFVIIIAPKGKKQIDPEDETARIEIEMNRLLDSVCVKELGDSVKVLDCEEIKGTTIRCKETEMIESMRGLLAAIGEPTIILMMQAEFDSLSAVATTKPDRPGWSRKIHLQLKDGMKVGGFQLCDKRFVKSKLAYLHEEADTTKKPDSETILNEIEKIKNDTNENDYLLQ